MSLLNMLVSHVWPDSRAQTQPLGLRRWRALREMYRLLRHFSKETGTARLVQCGINFFIVEQIRRMVSKGASRVKINCNLV
jgi:hypothetical protein